MARTERMTVIRDGGGHVINIGPWDYLVMRGACRDLAPESDGDPDEEIEVVTNPYPEGATETEEDVIIGDDGSRHAANP